MDADSTKAYEIIFPDGRKVRCAKIGPAEQAAIDVAVQFGERVVITISPIAGPQMMVAFEGDVGAELVELRKPIHSVAVCNKRHKGGSYIMRDKMLALSITRSSLEC